MRELKTLLEIDPYDTSDDKRLLLLIEMASNWIMELCNRPGWDYKSRTEFYSGTGTEKLLLRSRPVYTTPTIQVWEDETGNFGSMSGSFGTETSLTFGDDFFLWIDQEDGASSRCGILIRKNKYWPRPSQRSNPFLTPYVGRSWGIIKVTYTAGYLVDNLPAAFRQACTLLVAKLLTVFPLGAEMTSDSYEDRSVSINVSQKLGILKEIEPLIRPYRNFKW